MRARWPHWLLAKANLLLWRGYMYRPGPPEDFYDCMTGDVVTRTDLARTYGEDLVRRVERVKGAPARKGLAIGDGYEAIGWPVALPDPTRRSILSFSRRTSRRTSISMKTITMTPQ
jgi:hypothetical protein